ncbi:rCG37007 [Rattus norvegicus]|uniref:RCG37007 n=1 Tax=Rattus norvegicus TaxID=10116 RepID=A6HU84_RAT|nr:rCG37007 [Rattus norvegicus]
MAVRESTRNKSHCHTRQSWDNGVSPLPVDLDNLNRGGLFHRTRSESQGPSS